MTDDEALDRIRAALNETLGVSPDGVVPGANLRDDLELDSLDLAELLAAIEDQTDQVVGTERIDGVETVGDVVALVRDLAGRAGE